MIGLSIQDLKPNEMSEEKAKQQVKEQMKKLVQGFTNVPRSPILRRPNEYGMEYDDVFFPALDGTVLEGWFIPAKEKSDKFSEHPEQMIEWYNSHA